MRILKRVLRKLYHLIAFLGLFMLFITNVNAQVSNFSFSNIKYYDKNGQKSPTTYTSTTTNTLYYGLNMTSSKFTIIFDNNLSNYDEIGFELYDNFSEISSNPNYGAPIMPLVILDGYPCTVTPIGIMDQDQTYHYNGDEYALCSVKQKTGSHYIDVFTYKPSSMGNLFVGVHKDYCKGFSEDTSLKDVLEQQQQTQQAITDVDDTLNNSTVDSSDSTINDLKTQIPTNNVISNLLLLPVRFLQNFVNALGSSCSQFNLGSLYGTNLFMPCINLQNYLGSGIWTTIDLIMSGFFIYALRKKFIQIYENLTNLTNGGNEVD